VITIKEAAEILRVSESTIRRWISEERIIAIKVGKQYRIAESVLLDILSYGL